MLLHVVVFLTVYGRSFPVSTRQCPRGQSQLHIEMVWSKRTWQTPGFNGFGTRCLTITPHIMDVFKRNAYCALKDGPILFHESCSLATYTKTASAYRACSVETHSGWARWLSVSRHTIFTNFIGDTWQKKIYFTAAPFLMIVYWKKWM